MKMETELHHRAVAPLVVRAGTAAQNNPGKEAPSSGPHPVERLGGQVSAQGHRTNNMKYTS